MDHTNNRLAPNIPCIYVYYFILYQIRVISLLSITYMYNNYFNTKYSTE